MVTSSDKQLTDNIAITVLLGLLGLIIVGVYNTAFKKGFFTCQHYVLNTYLYILMALVIICLEILAFDLHNLDILKYLQGVLPFIITLIVVIGTLWITMKINPRHVILKHLAWLVFITTVSLLAYPSYLKSKESNTLRGVFLSLVAILVIFTVVVFIKPELVYFSWGPVLSFLLIGVIISHLIFMFTTNKRTSTQNKNYMKYSSYFIIVLFIFFIMYDTKLIIEAAKICSEKTADYINQSLGIILDTLNIFQNLVNISS